MTSTVVAELALVALVTLWLTSLVTAIVIGPEPQRRPRFDWDDPLAAFDGGSEEEGKKESREA